MPKGTLYQSQALTNVAVAYKNENLIGDLVMPSVPVNKQSGKVYKFGKDAFSIPTKIIRAPGATSARVQSFSVSTDSYYCDNHALNDFVAQEDLDNADVAIAPEISMTEGLTNIIKLAREKALSDYIFNVTTFAGYTAALAAADRWNNYNTSDPLKKFSDISELIRKATGRKPNTLVIGSGGFEAVRLHPDIVAKFQYVQGGILNEQQVKLAFGVDNLLIGKAVYNSADEGQSASMADVWGKYALAAYIAPKPGLREPSLGYSYRWNTGTQGYQVFRTEKNEAGSEHGVCIEVMNYFDDIVHDAAFGYLLSTLID